VDLPEPDVRRLCRGQTVPVPAVPEGVTPGEAEVAVFDAAGRLAAVAEFDPRRKLLRPAKVIRG
jgi:Pseudouridine synthase II TruB, C-terminal